MKGYITKITTQKNNQERYNIFLDQGNGEEYGFSVDQAVLIKFQLKKGKILDDFELENIFFGDEVKKGVNLALYFLSFKMRSAKEIRTYLNEKEIDEPIIIEVLHKLTDLGYLNDQEYAFAYVRTQIKTTDKGPEVIKKELYEKGISSELIFKSLEQYPLSDQIKTLAKIHNKFFNKNVQLSDRQKKVKLEQLCIRKGFSLTTMELALAEIEFVPDKEQELTALKHHADKAHRKYQHLEGYEYRQKMKQALYRKGFSLDLIDDYLNSGE